MANTSKSTAAKEKTEAVVETPAVTKESNEMEKPIIPKDIDQNGYIPVRNGFHGALVYVSGRTGEIFKWDSFGDEQEIELRELKSAKSSSKDFFINNWFMFDEEYEWVIDYLGLTQYYKNAVRLDGFDDIFSLSPSELEKKIAGLSNGQKGSVAYYARQKVLGGEIDSRKVIAALEKSLGIELIEK